MATSSGDDDFVVLSNGNILSNATSPDLLANSAGNVAVQNYPSKEAPRRNVSANGCLQLHSMLKTSFLPVDDQRTPQVLSQCCHPCPYHHPLNNHNNPQERLSLAGNTAPSPLTSCCPNPHTEYSASACQKHAPLYQTACCLQSSPSFCLHHPWPEHFQHHPVQQHISNIR